MESGASADLRLETDGTTKIVNGSFDDGQPQPRALRLRRKKSFKNVRLVIRRNAAAGVLDIEPHLPAVRVEPYENTSTIRHGLSCVYQQVQDRAAKLTAVSSHSRHACFRIHPHFDARLLEVERREIDHFAYKFGQIDLLQLVFHGAQ